MKTLWLSFFFEEKIADIRNLVGAAMLQFLNERPYYIYKYIHKYVMFCSLGAVRVSIGCFMRACELYRSYECSMEWNIFVYLEPSEECI